MREVRAQDGSLERGLVEYWVDGMDSLKVDCQRFIRDLTCGLGKSRGAVSVTLYIRCGHSSIEPVARALGPPIGAVDGICPPYSAVDDGRDPPHELVDSRVPQAF